MGSNYSAFLDLCCDRPDPEADFRDVEHRIVDREHGRKKSALFGDLI